MVNETKHTAQQLVPEPSVFEMKNFIEEIARNNSPGIDQIPSEPIKVRG